MQVQPAEVGPARRQVRSLRGVRRALWWGGVGIFAVMLWFLSEESSPLTQSPVVMIGSFITGYARITVGLAAGCLVLWAACLLVWLRELVWGSAGRLTPSRPMLGKAGAVLSRVGSVAAGVTGIVPVMVCLEGIDVEGPDARMPFRVLSPASTSGCRIITWKQPVDPVYGSRVSVYVKEPGSLLARTTHVGWQVPGTDDPIAAGAWSLSWDGDHAHLTVWNQNNSTQRYLPASTLTCCRLTCCQIWAPAMNAA